MSKCGERIKEMRDLNGWSVRELAEKINSSEASISRWENGLYMPKAKDIGALADLFKINPVWLMGLDGVSKYVTKKEAKAVPLVGNIAAGQPTIANEQIEDYEFIPEGQEIDFCLRVQGNSMKNARIYDGDIIFIRKQSDVDSGEIAVVIIGHFF